MYKTYPIGLDLEMAVLAGTAVITSLCPASASHAGAFVGAIAAAWLEIIINRLVYNMCALIQDYLEGVPIVQGPTHVHRSVAYRRH